MIDVAIADDHAVVRQGFAFIINSQCDMRVVGEAADGKKAYDLVARVEPHVLLLDISMPPGENGLIACERISCDFPSTRIIILTMFEETDYLFYTLRGGAAGYVLKNSSTEVLLGAIRKVATGETYIEPNMAQALSGKLHGQSGAAEKNPYHELSSREFEIFSLLAQGYTNKETADKLFISVKTVETHRSKIYAKLGVNSRAELVHLAIKYHLLDL